MEAQDLWAGMGVSWKQSPVLTATFPSGAIVQFKVCGNDRDISNYDGGQYSLVIFDEGQNHTETQLRYLESRIRSKAKGPHQLVVTCNPKYDHEYLLKFVRPYLDPITGIPRPEMFAVERYYGAYQGDIVVGASEAELEALYPGIKCQTYSFISANLYSNPRMKILNPTYWNRLENLKRVERERLLLGSWFAKETTAGFFKRDWVEEVDSPPPDEEIVDRVRGMDLAFTLASESNPNPDWTASVMMSKTKQGYYYVEHVERYREYVNSVLEHIVATHNKDKELGFDPTVIIPRDTGSGVATNVFFTQYLTDNGCDVRSDIVSGAAGKLKRMQPFLSLAEAGLVKVVKGEWNSVFYNELEDYVDRERQQKDDIWDATATATRQLIKNVGIPNFTIPILSQSSPIPRL